MELNKISSQSSHEIYNRVVLVMESILFKAAYDSRYGILLYCFNHTEYAGDLL